MASKIYTALETTLTFADSAQTPSATLTLTALASLAGRVSARFDRGAGSHASLYWWQLNCALTGTNVVGDTVEVYAFESDGTNVDGQIGTADAALASAKRNNAKYLGILQVDQTTSNTLMTVSGTIFLVQRYISIGVWNASSLPFQTSTAVHSVKLTPAPFEAQ